MKLIVAVSKNWGIGKNNDLLWHLPEDMKFFKETTAGSIIITGRKNYESIPAKFRPLPGRENIILTRDLNYTSNHPKMHVVHNWEDILKKVEELQSENPEKSVFVIGGGQIYKQALNQGLISEMYITHVHHDFEADVFFPPIDLSLWQKKEEQFCPENETRKLGFSFCKYVKKE
jgi:dihydrofolate reductase